MKRHDDPADLDPSELRNGNVKIPIYLALILLLGALVSGYMTLDAKKADKDSVEAMHNDIREIRTFLMGPKR